MSIFHALLLDPYREVGEIFLAARTDGNAGCGTRNDPYNASTAKRFDAIMRSLPGNCCVYLGPGNFDTYGYSDEYPPNGEADRGWSIPPRTRIIGAGIGATTLRLVPPPPTDPRFTVSAHYFAIGHPLKNAAATAPSPVDFCEVAELTIHCGVDAQPAYAGGAVRLMGDHVRVRQVRAICWGAYSRHCFVFALITGDRSTSTPWEGRDAGIEHCIADEPALTIYSGSPTVSVFHLGGAQNTAMIKEAFGLAPFIRNCVVDCITLGDLCLARDVRALSVAWCRSAIVDGNQLHNLRTGGPYLENASCRDMIVRDNTYKNVVRGPYWKIGAASNAIGSNPAVAKADPLATVATVTTSVHDLTAGDRVRVSCSTTPAYNGVFLVREVINATQFTVDVSLPSPVSAGLTSVQKVFGLSNLLVEQNTIELAPGAATVDYPAEVGIQVDDGKENGGTPGVSADPIHDSPDYDGLEVIVRGNHIRYLNGQFETNYAGTGIRIAGIEHVIVKDNIIECATGNPMQDFRCGTVAYGMNRRSAGTLIRGVDGLSATKAAELESDAEDALVLALL